MSWIPLPKRRPLLDRDARLQVHWAAQVPAAIGDRMIPKREDWSHSALSWQSEQRAFVSEAAGARSAALFVDELTVAYLEGDQERDRYPLDGSTLIKGLEWLSAKVGQTLGLSELTIPEHEVKTRARPFSVSAEQLRTVGDLFSNAYELCVKVKADDPRAGPIRVWPHHFDVATLIMIDPHRSVEDARSMGVGFSPGDDSYDEPYLYVTPWPYPDARRLPDLAGPGHWHTDGWIGGVLELSDLPADAHAGDLAENFLRTYSQAAESLL